MYLLTEYVIRETENKFQEYRKRKKLKNVKILK